MSASTRPSARRARLMASAPDLGVVALGGAAGSLLRHLIASWMGDTGDLPIATLTVNLCGAFLLGMLVEGLTRLGADRGRLRTTRLLLGTGLLGGFTTYSLLAVDIASLLLGGDAWLALGYSLTTLVGGATASWCGVLAGRIITRPSVSRSEGEAR